MTNETQKKNNAATLPSRSAYLRELAESSERLDIRLTNNYAFRKIFKNKLVAKGFIMALLKLKEEDIEALEVIDPFEE